MGNFEIVSRVLSAWIKNKTVNSARVWTKTFVKEACATDILKPFELLSCLEFEGVSRHAAQRSVFAMAGY